MSPRTGGGGGGAYGQLADPCRVTIFSYCSIYLTLFDNRVPAAYVYESRIIFWTCGASLQPTISLFFVPYLRSPPASSGLVYLTFVCIVDYLHIFLLSQCVSKYGIKKKNYFNKKNFVVSTTRFLIGTSSVQKKKPPVNQNLISINVNVKACPCID